MDKRQLVKIKKARKYLENIDLCTDVNPIAEAIHILTEIIQDEEKSTEEKRYDKMIRRLGFDPDQIATEFLKKGTK